MILSEFQIISKNIKNYMITKGCFVKWMKIKEQQGPRK